MAHEGGDLLITLVCAEDLKDVDWAGKQDPYCKVVIGHQVFKSGTHKDGGKNPAWNQQFSFTGITSTSRLEVTVYDENLLLKDEQIGIAAMDLAQVVSVGSQNVRLPVITKKNKHRGDIKLKLRYRPPGGAFAAAPAPTPREAPPRTPIGGYGTVGSQSMNGSNYNNNNNGGGYGGYGGAPTPTARPASASGPPPHTPVPYTPQAPVTAAVKALPTQFSTQASISRAPPPGDWVLPDHANTDCWRYYAPVKVLGKGAYGTTYLSSKKDTKEHVAIKVISKSKLKTAEEKQDVRYEIQAMHHLKGHENIVELMGVYEDQRNICIVMELCAGGELFDAILKRGVYTERDAAALMRTIVSAVAHCHNMGVIHRDLKPENFLLTSKGAIKMADFGLSFFFKEKIALTDVVGSSYYVAPEVLARRYSKEADIWSCGVLLYLLLCGDLPFKGRNDNETFHEVMRKEVDLRSYPWPKISAAAKDCVSRMLTRDPAARATAADILRHDWLRENGVATDTPIELEVVKRIKKFSAMNVLKKEALRVIAVSLPPAEVNGLRELFMEIDKDKNGSLTESEFREALRKKGHLVGESDMKEIMKAADLNNDGSIDYEEFMAAMMDRTRVREETLLQAFQFFDTDNSGSISRTELAEALGSMQLTDSQITKLIQEADRDGDGQIDFREFCAMMRQL